MSASIGGGYLTNVNRFLSRWFASLRLNFVLSLRPRPPFDPNQLLESVIALGGVVGASSGDGFGAFFAA